MNPTPTPNTQLTQNQKQQQLKANFESAGGAEAWVERIERECIEGSAISPALVKLNVNFLEDTGRWEINDRLGQDISRWYEGNLETGEWNRYRNHNYLAAAFFTSENGEIFNAKVANPKENFEKSKGFGNKEEWVPTGKMRRYEAVTNGGNRVFYPSLPDEIRKLISHQQGIQLPSCAELPEIWPWIFEHPEISVGIAEGAKKALALCSQGFLCVAVLGIANWSVPRTEQEKDEKTPRQLMPELAELAKGGRQVPVWYDQDDTKSNLKAFLNTKREGHLFISALKAAEANKKTDLMFWPSYLGKGIDDVIVRLIQQGNNIREWVEETIAVSKNAAIYDQVKILYALAKQRAIESSTVGDHLSVHLAMMKLKHGHIHAIIAGIGAGKTTFIKEKIKDWITTGGFVVVITPTNNLGKQLAEDVGLPHRHDYLHDVILQMKAQADSGFVCCLDSLPKLEKSIPSDMPLLVVCEEADQVANHATNGKTFQGKYAVTLECFQRVLTRAASVILAEARIPENTLQFFEKMSGKPTRIFIHHTDINKRQVTCYHGHISGFEALIFQRLRKGERILVPSDSQHELEKLERLIKQEMPELKSMRNDRKTAYLPEIKKLNVSPNKVLAKEQLFFLELSPACKSGISLDGRDNHGHTYEFDWVMGIFLVLPTSEQIQLIGRYRPSCPWEIYLAETIQISGDETARSPRKLSRQMAEEAQKTAAGWDIPYHAKNRPPLEQIAREHYVVATVRAGLEKSINRYSMVQRLIEDGHSVVEEELGYHKKMADRMKAISDEIDQEWGDLVAAIPLADGDTVEMAKRLEQMETPTPEQRAKAEKISLVVQHPGVDFDNPLICYYATRKYKAMLRGVALEAAARNLSAVADAQKAATIKQYEASILAVHLLPRKAQRAALILDSGILELTSGDAIFTSVSPEVLELKRKILARAEDWQRNFGFHFEAHQAPISFLTRAAKCLGVKFHVTRSGVDARLYQYQAYSLELIDELLMEAIDHLEGERAKYAQKTSEELDKIVGSKADKSRQEFIQKYGRPPEDFEGELFREVISFDQVHPIDVLTADAQKAVSKLEALRTEVEIHNSLLDAVLALYADAPSIVSIDGDIDIENVDVEGVDEREGERSAPDIATE